jgi:hypothetical protein
MTARLPNPVMLLSEFQRTGSSWIRDGARTAVRPDGRIRIILQVLACRIEWRGNDGTWHAMAASYPVRERLSLLLEAWLEGKLPPMDQAG